MGMFDPVLDNSPIDKFGAQGNAGSLMQMANTQQQRGNELYDMNSTRNQMFKDSAMQDAFDVQGQQSMFAQRQAARSGQAFSPEGMDSSSAVRAQVQKQWSNQMMAQQQQSGSFISQAANMQGQAGSMRNSLNSMYRQQQQANQQAKQQAKAAKLSLASAAFGAIAGPATGAIGSGLGGMASGMGFQAGAQGYMNPQQDPSDIALKENIELVGKSPKGINIYEFDYKNKSYGEGRYRGVMAQEVPNASSKGYDGYLQVNYNKVDVDFERIS